MEINNMSISQTPITIKVKRNYKRSVKKTEPNKESYTEEDIKSVIEQSEIDEPKIKPHSVLNSLGDYIEEPFSIINSYFKGKYLERLVRHQTDSYNHFIRYQIQRTIHMFNNTIIHSENDYVPQYNKYLIEIDISFDNFKLHPPQIHENNGATKIMMPQEAKLRNFTYASAMTIDININYIIRNTEEMDNPKIIKKTLSKINIGKMPIMVKSAICVLTQNKHINPTITGDCAMDCGGYFIIKGSEKTVLGQERAAENKIYCFDGKSTTKWSWFAEIKSVPDFKCISPKQVEMMILSKNSGFGNGIYITIPRIKQPIELFVVFRALGIEKDKEICEYIMLNIDDSLSQDILNFLRASIMDASKYITKESAIRHITTYVAYTPINMDKETGIKKKYDFTIDVLNNDLFPHCKTLKQKLYLLGYMTNKLIRTSFGWLPVDDRDSYLNKRIELTGTLLNNLFRNYFNKLVKEMQKQVVREINNGSWRSTDDYENIINATNIYKILKSTTIENGINRALATGDFSIKQSNSSKVGVAQVLNRLTYLSSLSHLRRINTPLEKSGELIAPRKLHNTTFGFLCLTGDSEILLGNRIDTKQIRNIGNGSIINKNIVSTVNPHSLLDEKSGIHSYFSMMPDKLYELTTCSGRKIKATIDHPFLINTIDGEYVWKSLGKMCLTDKIIIRHSVNYVTDEYSIFPSIIIKKDSIPIKYIERLSRAGILDVELPLYKIKLLARLVGSLSVFTYSSNSQEEYTDMLCLNIDIDINQVIEDIQQIGLSVPEFKKTAKIYNNSMDNIAYCLTINHSNEFYHVMMCIGGFRITNGRLIKYVPAWIKNGRYTIKREFLSSFQGSYGHSLCVSNFDNQEFKPFINNINYVIHNDSLSSHLVYINNIVELFNDLYIKTDVVSYICMYDYIVLCIKIVDKLENLNIFADTINYTYNDKKRIDSAPVIEYLKMYLFNKKFEADFMNTDVNYIYTDKPSDCLIIGNTRKYNRYDLRIPYKEYLKINQLKNNCVSVPIFSIEEIAPETVYDFTTHSSNHSFVASSFVTHNCAVETPEGQSIGVVKNISYMTHITIPSDSSLLYDSILPQINKIDDVSFKELHNKVKVFINGAWVGVSDFPLELYNDIKDKKYKGIINIYTSVIFDYKMMEIRICNDGGRLTRPVLRVKNNDVIITNDIIDRLTDSTLEWNDLLTDCSIPESVIEYIDPDEQSLSMIAMKTKTNSMSGYNYRYTHCEIHASTIFGILASCIPFPESNQSPRNVYQTAMMKQALGIYSLNYDQRMDKTAYVLSYPSRPIVDTRIMNILHLNKIPSGQQIQVAIMSYTGYNQEDSVIVNEGAVNRGLFMATIYHTEKDEDKNIIRDEIIRCNPDPSKTKGIKFGNYSKLNSEGFIPENTLVENRDIIISKIVPIKENRNDPTKPIKYEDQSKIYRTNEETYIDRNFTGRNGDGYNFAKVRTRLLRKVCIGDKFASRSSQKGTCGIILPEEDMPFTKDGVRPDIILNPHAIPSRMTIAQLKETMLGKVLIELGMFGDGTSFGDLSVKNIMDHLQNLGFESHGNEILYNGMTGEQIETSIFIGPVFYQRLKHMVNDKQHSRSIGPMVNFTRQPAEGRSRDGGFRIGEMERDVMLAHGMSRFCRERLYDASDKYTTYICDMCGLIVPYNDGTITRMHTKNNMTVHHCKTCNNMTKFSRVEIPYAYKLLAQELQTINIVPRIITES